MSIDNLIEKIKKTNNPSVIGLDPNIDFIPKFILNKHIKDYGDTKLATASAVLEFNRTLIDALCDIVPAVKPQSAYYEALGFEGVKVFFETVKYAKQKGMYVIGDVKRNDIGSTASAYSKAYLSNDEYACDAITVNAYLGIDGVKPFIDDCSKNDKAIFVLVKTSNPSSGEIQNLKTTDGEEIYIKMAKLVKSWGEDSKGKYGYNAVGAVVGATYPAETEILRELMPNTYFLVPGYGAQGGTKEDARKSFNKDGLGAIVNSSRAIMCAYIAQGKDESYYLDCAVNEAKRMQGDLAF